ncbi:hypothetical protein BC834DRAFT_977043 [Gloeopeniophorella convolvens]|nr:hypothetical protein BC834DRAFT_977043 [Gloeopeniophorella convolvens]
MSSQIPGHPPGPQGFKQILDPAQWLRFVDAVIGVYEDQPARVQTLPAPAGKKGKVIAVLKPVVEVILALSTGGVLGDALGSAFRPAKAVLGGIGILLQAAKKVSASYDALVGLFESISNFLERLKIYTDGDTALHLE